MECYICLNTITNKVHCKHCNKYCCFECISTWLYNKSTCPHCRKFVIVSDYIDLDSELEICRLEAIRKVEEMRQIMLDDVDFVYRRAKERGKDFRGELESLYEAELGVSGLCIPAMGAMVNLSSFDTMTENVDIEGVKCIVSIYFGSVLNPCDVSIMVTANDIDIATDKMHFKFTLLHPTAFNKNKVIYTKNAKIQKICSKSCILDFIQNNQIEIKMSLIFNTFGYLADYRTKQVRILEEKNNALIDKFKDLKQMMFNVFPNINERSLLDGSYVSVNEELLIVDDEMQEFDDEKTLRLSDLSSDIHSFTKTNDDWLSDFLI